MKNTTKLMFISLLLSILSIHSILGSKPYCDIPKECQVIECTERHFPTNQKVLKCLLNDETRLRFNRSLFDNMENKSCQLLKQEETKEILIRPTRERSLRLKKSMIDYQSLIEYTKSFVDLNQLNVIFEFFNGFELNLIDANNIDFENKINTQNLNYYITPVVSFFKFCKFDFYSGDKLLKSCEDFQKATNSTNPGSIFQLFTNVFKHVLYLELVETNTKICPLAFKDVQIHTLQIGGENTFYSRRILSFSREKFDDLNSNIVQLKIGIKNVDLDFDFLNPSVFKSVSEMFFASKINKIDAEIFHILDNVTNIYLPLEYIRSLMHTNGIEWIKNMNREINCDLGNKTQVDHFYESGKIKYIHHDVENTPVAPSLLDVFPEEDFCLYKDYPENQLVVVNKLPKNKYEFKDNGNEYGCTYFWITRYYKELVKTYPNNSIFNLMMTTLLDSDDYKSISRCKFDERIKLCNRSNFEHRKITTFFEIGETMYIIEIVLNISSFIVSILGLVSNILIIITISSKLNKTDFKEFKQYDYLRLNSICNCLILIIHMTTWLNQCIYPFQLFCPIIRKAVFMQYFKIVVQDVLMTALRFMNSFTYIGFAFNRISLIGKDHNKLVKFMCKISIVKFIAITLFISIGLSVIKFFEYDINHGSASETYPILYDYSSSFKNDKPNIVFFILNFISDILNHLVFLFVNLSIDIGMIIKLRQTLNERLESFKAFSSTAQQEKKKTDNENVLDNAISMVILNSSLNLILKLPASIYSLIFLCYGIYRQYSVPFIWENRNLERFFKRVCMDANFCNMLLNLSDFFYLLSISLQFFFYKHYDKKLNSAIKKKFSSKRNIQTGLYSLFNLVNMVTSPNIADETYEHKKSNK